MSTTTAELDTLVAKALDELRTLPEAQVRQVLEAARVALEGTAVRVSAQLAATPAISAAFVDTATVTDACDAEVVPGLGLPPATSFLAKLLAKENRPLAIALIGLATTCAGHLREQRGQQVIVNNNITVVTPQCPRSAPMAPEDGAPGAPRARGPLPQVKTL